MVFRAARLSCTSKDVEEKGHLLTMPAHTKSVKASSPKEVLDLNIRPKELLHTKPNITCEVRDTGRKALALYLLVPNGRHRSALHEKEDDLWDLGSASSLLASSLLEGSDLPALDGLQRQRQS